MRNNSWHVLRRGAASIGLILVVVGSCVLCGCGRGRPIEAARRTPGTVLWIVGLDTTRSIPAQTRNAFFLELAQQAGRLEARDKLCLLLVDRGLTEIFNNSPLRGTEANLRMLRAETKFEATPEEGTYPERFWADVVHRADQAGARTVVITLMSDGENSDLRALSKVHIRAAAKRLRKDSRVAMVMVVGVHKMHRAYLRDCFQELGDRFLMMGTSEADAQAISMVIEAARNRGSK